MHEDSAVILFLINWMVDRWLVQLNEPCRFRTCAPWLKAGKFTEGKNAGPPKKTAAQLS
jgi:hypothetical protein